jgi:periplasmic protein CpxP/Spy
MDTPTSTPALPPSSSAAPSAASSALAPSPLPAPGENHVCGEGRRRHGFMAGLVLGIAGAGLIGFAIGATMPVAEAAFEAFGPGSTGHHSMGGPPSLDDARDHAEFFVAFALHRLDATGDQEQKVKDIVDSAIGDLFPVVEKHRTNRDELHAVLAAPVVDRAAIESLRVEEIALADSLSKTLAAAIADTAEALTAEQRQQLLQQLERFRHHR